MFAYFARRGAKKALLWMGASQEAANALSWVVWGGTVALTLDAASVAGEAVATAGGELIGGGAEALGLAGEAGAFAADVGTAVADVVTVAAEVGVPAAVAIEEIGLEYKALLAEDRNPGLSIRILLAAADPDDETRLHLDREFRQIRQCIQKSKLRDKFVFDSCLAARPEDLVQALLDHDTDIVHFSGHGTASGCLCFENEAGDVVIVRPEAIGRIFAQLPKRLRCVVLNACYSAKQADEILRHVDYVIAMKKEIGDAAAIAFSSGLYQGLGAGLGVEKAFEIGVSRIQFGPTNQHLIPMLLKNKS